MTTTTKLGMTHIENTDHLVGTSIADGLMFKVNDALDTIDDQIGAVVCTSGTRPSSPYPGQPIYETDTRNMLIRNVANSAWVIVNQGIPVYSTTGAVSGPFTNMIIYDVSFAGLKIWNGSAWVIFDPNTQHKFKATNTSKTSTTTLGNDPDFVFSMAANAAYKIDGYCPYTALAGSSSGGLSSDFTLPTGGSLLWTNFGTVTNNGTLTDYNVVAQALASTRSVAGNAGTTMSFQPKGVFVIGATAGLANFRWAQSTSSGTATVLLAGAWMSVTRIA